DAGVELDLARVGEMRGADLQHLRAVLGEAARAGRTGEHAREIQRAYALQGSFPFGKSFGRSVADARDLEQRRFGHGLRLRMPRPFLGAAHEARAAARGMDRIFELGTAP